MHDLFLRALRCEKVSRPPVWLMRQAGRYMPQYAALRKNHSLWEMFHKPDLAADVTCLPVQHLRVDAAILFSDILVIAEALGLSVQFPESGGPRIIPAVQTEQQVLDLPTIPVEECLGFVYETIRLVKSRLDVPLIGFSGGPFTVASYFLDSANHANFQQTQHWIEHKPQLLHALLEKITEATIAHLQEQICAGVDAVQIFDSWANILNDEQFATFCIPYLEQIVSALKETVIPVILFCRDSSLREKALAALNPQAISLDWHRPIGQLRGQIPLHIAVQGNFHPELLKTTPSQIEKEVNTALANMQNARGYIVNLGHGVLPDTPYDNVRCFVDYVKSQ